MQIDKQQPEN